MAKSMFQSYKGALIFAGSTLMGVALLVGSEDKEGALVVAASELERQRELADKQNDFAPSATPAGNRPSREREPEQPSESFGFTPDEELIDDTRGFDPTPPENGFGWHDPTWGEPQIVHRQSEIITE